MSPEAPGWPWACVPAEGVNDCLWGSGGRCCTLRRVGLVRRGIGACAAGTYVEVLSDWSEPAARVRAVPWAPGTAAASSDAVSLVRECVRPEGAVIDRELLPRNMESGSGKWM